VAFDDVIYPIRVTRCKYTAAQNNLEAAARDAQVRVAHLESAAAGVSNIANEGIKRSRPYARSW
jgi:hypothetical protein